MSSKKLATRYFTRLKGKKKSINNVEFRTSINVLKQEAAIGFEEEEVDTLIDALVHIEGLAFVKFQELLNCIIPHRKVASKSTLRLLQWIFTYHSSASVGSVVAALNWIIGLLEFCLTDECAIHAFYHHFLLLLEKRNTAKFACKLIHLLTKPSDVTRWLVVKVLDIENKYGHQFHTTALLGLFKSYKPECVPEKVRAVNLRFAFPGISKINPYFQQAQQRLGNEHKERLKRKIVWDTDGGMKRVNTKKTIQVIPPVDYIHFESQKYRAESKQSILEFDTIVSLGSNCQQLDMPCNLMSLLQNDAGIHIIAFGDKTLQTRFSFNLYYTLYTVFIEQVKGNSYEEKEKLLNQIVALERYTQQGIPAVSRFLAEYMCLWDTEDFRETIFNLIHWVTFRSYQELHDLILDRIRTMFLCGSVEVKSSIVAMLRKLVQNMIVFGLSKRNKNGAGGFLRNKEQWSGIETVQCVITFVTKLCELGLSVEQENYMLLDETLNFFEMMIFLEERYELPIWTMTPPVVVYSGLITRNAVMLSRVCNILLKYENAYARLKKMKLRQKFTAQVNYQEMYLIDFINCLWESKCFVNRESYLFKNVSESHLRRLSKYIEPNDALLLVNHCAMLPYIALMQKNSSVLESSKFDYEDILIIINTNLEEIYNLIQLVNAQFEEV